MPRLENWGILATQSPYSSPESYKGRLVGQVYEHPTHPDGKRIATSGIIGIEGDLIITENGSRYSLGEPDPNYEAMFSDAKQRVFERLKGPRHE